MHIEHSVLFLKHIHVISKFKGSKKIEKINKSVNANMNLQTIRQRFSMFLKQFRIEDLKLLMKFLNEIVIEYKNSNASRLFGW